MSKKLIQKIKFKLLLQSFLCFFISLLLVNPTFANNPSEAALDFYNLNGIYYYNQNGSNYGYRGVGGFCIGENTNYAGVQVWTDTEMEAIQANYPFYSAASKEALAETGVLIPWQAIATIHYLEHSLSRSNPDNGEGIYQLTSYTNGGTNSNAFPSTHGQPVSDEEFTRQTKIAVKEVMVGKANGLDLTTDVGIKTFFLRYNGSGGDRYRQKAIALGYDGDTERYEGSPYVMNRYDAARDTGSGFQDGMNPAWPGLFVGNNQYDPNATMGNRFGAFVKYQALSGNGSEVCTGGLTVEEIKNLMTDYYTQSCEDWGIYCAYSSTGGKMANCVTFVQYFLTRYNNQGLTITGTGNGADVVTNLINRDIGITGVNGTGGPGDTYGTVPRVFAVFGIRRGSAIDPDTGIPYGHTGIVLGIDEANNKILIGQAGLNSSINYSLTTIEQDLDAYTNTEYMYAYTEGFIDAARVKADFGL